jgi:hypothetical protein
MKPVKKSPPRKRLSVISRVRLKQSKEDWLDFFIEAFMLSVTEMDIHTHEKLKEASARARAIADIGLEELEERWKGV